MKKLNLLKPTHKKGFLEDGKGEKVSYLCIPETLGCAELEEDVKNGAALFKDLAQAAKNGLSRVVVVQGKSAEHVLMAVTYMAAICNEYDNKERLGNMDEEYLEDAYDYWDEEPEDDCGTAWVESPWKIPVIRCHELCEYDRMEMYKYANNLAFTGVPYAAGGKPYWAGCVKEMVCILLDDVGNNVFCSVDYNMVTEKMIRFTTNRHVFVAVVKKDGMSDRSGLCQFVLENTADVITLEENDEKLEKYRLVQFDNWLECMDIHLKKGVVKKEIVQKIVKMNNDNKSEMMEKVLLYVQKESRKTAGEPLGQEDFKVLGKMLYLKEGDSSESSVSALEKELVGMERVKSQIKGIVNVMKYNQIRKEQGYGKSTFHNVHLLIGAPGTAKTTVAKLMGNMMREEGLLPGNRFACVNGAELKGMYVGHSAPKTQQLFNENDIILIDEAYSLTDKENAMDSFSNEAIAQMILEIEAHGTSKLIMFAGYGGMNVNEKDNKMKQFLDANPGLKSRINSTIYFDSYTPGEMVEIVHKQAELSQLSVDHEADGIVQAYFSERCGQPDFGNGREARSLIENAMVYAAERIMALPKSKLNKKNMCELTRGDIAKAIDSMEKGNHMQYGQKNRCGFL